MIKSAIAFIGTERCINIIIAILEVLAKRSDNHLDDEAVKVIKEVIDNCKK